MAKRINQKGLTLIEVLIALAIFAAISTVLLTTVSINMYSSILAKSDVKLHNLAEFKMNEVLIGDREFTEATNNSEETGAFEIEGFKDYKFKVEIRKIELPDLASIMGKSEESQERIETQQDQIRKKVFGILKKNIEEIVWQVKVEITSPENQVYELTSWIEKSNAEIDNNFGF